MISSLCENQMFQDRKKYISDRLKNAIENSNQNCDGQQSSNLSNNVLYQSMNFIEDLWQEYLKVSASRNTMKIYNSINYQKQFEPQSSIIHQRDNQWQPTELLDNNFEEISKLNILENESQKNENQLNYEQEIIQQREQNNYVTEIEKRIAWLNDIIKKNSSIISNEEKSSSNVSEKSHGLVEASERNENIQHNQEGQGSSVASDSQIDKKITIEELRNFKNLLELIAVQVKENQSMKQDLEDCKQTIQKQLIKIKEQKNNSKCEEILKQYFEQSKKEDELPQIKDHALYDMIKDEVTKISSIGDKIKQDQIITSTKNIRKYVQSLKSRAHFHLQNMLIAQGQVENYQNFIRMALVPQKNKQSKKSNLPQEIINKLWTELNISKQEENEIVRMLKYNQRKYFQKLPKEKAEKHWQNWKCRFSDSITCISELFKNIIDLQQDFQEQLKNQKTSETLKIELLQFQEKSLQLIENEIEKKEIISVKENIKQILVQNQ